MFGRSYLTLSIVCSLLASPIAWYAVSEWLKQFNEKIPISPWVFLITCVIISLITLITITIQNYRTASSNPVNSLKSE